MHYGRVKGVHPFGMDLQQISISPNCGVAVVASDGLNNFLHTDINTTEEIIYISKARPRNWAFFTNKTLF